MISHRDLAQLVRGFLMGGADIVPGVSGGTVALVLGIYERLVAAISRFDLTLLGLVRERRWRPAAEHVDLRFLVGLACGIGLGIVSLASLMHYLLQHERQHTLAVFFGLILGSVVVVAGMLERWTWRTVTAAVGAALLAYWVVGLMPARGPEGFGYLFLCGMVAICAMILPGISGAFILLLLGKYETVTGYLRSLLHGDLSTGTLLPILVFAIGAGLGLLSFSKVLRWLLEHYHAATVAGLCGFMAGSLRKIWPFKIDLTPEAAEFQHKLLINVFPDPHARETWVSAGLIVAGVVVVLVLEWMRRRQSIASGKPDR